MKGKKTIVLLSAIMLITSVNLWAQQQLTVAVRGFDASGGLTQDEGNAITDIFISELVSTGRVMVVDRNSFDAIIAEMRFGASDWSNNNNVVRLGRALNASHIIQGTVTSLGGRIVITVRVLNISTVQFIASPNLQLANMNEIFDKLPPFVRDLVLNWTDNSTVYRVGEIGPSGGYVFYDKGSYSDGWRYLEAAPASSEFRAYQNNAVTLCLALNINRLTGWRLPTKDELNIMYGSLKQLNLGGFSDDSYWSSSNENYSINIWCQNFNSGIQSVAGPSNSKLVRAVRQF
jgi:TolB-like protein